MEPPNYIDSFEERGELREQKDREFLESGETLLFHIQAERRWGYPHYWEMEFESRMGERGLSVKKEYLRGFFKDGPPKESGLWVTRFFDPKRKRPTGNLFDDWRPDYQRTHGADSARFFTPAELERMKFLGGGEHALQWDRAGTVFACIGGLSTLLMFLDPAAGFILFSCFIAWMFCRIKASDASLKGCLPPIIFLILIFGSIYGSFFVLGQLFCYYEWLFAASAIGLLGCFFLWRRNSFLWRRSSESWQILLMILVILGLVVLAAGSFVIMILMTDK